jgi:hypothetical protein
MGNNRLFGKRREKKVLDKVEVKEEIKKKGMKR